MWLCLDWVTGAWRTERRVWLLTFCNSSLPHRHTLTYFLPITVSETERRGPRSRSWTGAEPGDVAGPGPASWGSNCGSNQCALGAVLAKTDWADSPVCRPRSCPGNASCLTEEHLLVRDPGPSAWALTPATSWFSCIVSIELDRTLEWQSKL